MERQRVVHFAKTRTARVLSPVYRNRQSPSLAATTSDTSHAPLASIDSDLVVITKRRDETNTAPDLWDQIRKSVPMSTSGIFDPSNFFNEQNEYIPARTYVKLRSNQSEYLLADPSEDRQADNYNEPLPFPRQNPSTITINGNNLASSSHLSPTPVENTVMNNEIRPQKESQFMDKQFKGTETHKSPDTKYLINRHTNINCEHSGASKNPNETETKSRKLFLTQHISHVPEANSIPNKDTQKSLTFPRANEIHTNQPNFSGNTITQLNLKRIKNDQNSKLGLHYATSKHQQSHQETKDFDIPKEGHSLVLLPEKSQPVKCMEKEEIALPEMYSLSPSAYSSNIRLTAERISRTYTICEDTTRINANENKEHSSSSPVCINNKNPHSTTVDKKSTTHFFSSINLTESQQRSQTACFNDHSFNHGSHMRNNDSRRFEVANNIGDSLGKNIASNPTPEPSFSIKRHSLKLATYGCSSSSDLEGYFERSTTRKETLPFSEEHVNFNTNHDSYRISPSHALRAKCPDGLESSIDRRHHLPNNANSKNQRDTDFLDFNKLYEHRDETKEVKRLSFKLATSNEAFRDKDLNKSGVALSGCDKTPLSRNKGEKSVYHYQGLTRIPVNTHTKEPDTDFYECRNQRNVKHHYNDEEMLRKLKRHSFMLATHSMSDLTLLDEFMQYERDLETNTQEQLSDKSFSSCSFYTPDSRIGRHQDGSFNSSRHNSSTGSFYSCRSLDIPKHQQLKNISVTSSYIRSQINQDQTPLSLTCGQREFRHSVDSDSSVSGDSSVHLTASDNSFITAEGSSNNSMCRGQAKQRSFKLPVSGLWRKTPGSCHDSSVQNNVQPFRDSCKASTLSTRSQTSKHMNPLTMFSRYGCGFYEGSSAQIQSKRRTSNSRRVADRSRVWINPEYAHGKQREDRKRRSKSAPSARRTRSLLTSSSTKHVVSTHAQKHTDHKNPTSNFPFSNRITGSSLSGPETSAFHDSSWEAVRRIPPSLGRPRRKLYAGFDSQPLPMDNFLSDSSSVYSTQSCSSWSTSKSATTESTSKIPEKPSKARSVSSISSCAITPTNQVSQTEVFDFFTFTDKRSSVCDNKHNLYLSRQNSAVDDCFKDRFYDKAYSKESLASILSDGTTVNMDLNMIPKDSSDYIKPRLTSSSSITEFHDNDFTSMGEKQLDKRFHLDKFNNFHGSASLPKQQSLSRGKFFSCKDILDLVMASERNYQHSRGRSRSLERQAHKMCEIILCIGAE